MLAHKHAMFIYNPQHSDIFNSLFNSYKLFGNFHVHKYLALQIMKSFFPLHYSYTSLCFLLARHWIKILNERCVIILFLTLREYVQYFTIIYGFSCELLIDNLCQIKKFLSISNLQEVFICFVVCFNYKGVWNLTKGYFCN